MLTFYKEALSLTQADFSLIQHDDAIVATVYKVTQLGKDDLVLKIHRYNHHYWRERFFLNYFSNKIPVPQIIEMIDPLDGTSGAILMECLPGAILTMAEVNTQLAYDIGLILAQIHLNSTPGYGEMAEQNFSAGPKEQFTKKFLKHAEECINLLPETTLERCINHLEQHSHLLDSVDGPRIVHRDFRPGNIIARDGKVQGIIDWAASWAGFAEEDFCMLEHSVTPIGSANMASLLLGYESIRPVPNYKSILPLLRLHKSLAYIAFVHRNSIRSNDQFYAYNLKFINDTV